MLELWSIIRKRWILISVLPIITTLLAVAVTMFVLTPQYRASTTLLVNQMPPNQQLQYDSILANEALVNTYSDIVKSTTVEVSVIQQLHLPYTPSQLNKMVVVSSPNQSQVIQVSVIAPSDALAVQIVNALAHTFQTQAQTLMKMQNIQVIDPALPASHPSPVKPNKKLDTAISFIIGLMVSIGLALLLEILDNRIRSEEDARRYFNLPILGSIVEYKTE